MKTHEHAAQLADLLQLFLENHNCLSKPENWPSKDAWPEAASRARQALAAWHKHNAPAPQQTALNLTGE